MPSKQKKKALVIGVIGLVLLAFIYFNSGGSFGGDGSKRVKVSCDVRMHNNIGFDPVIESASCTQESSFLCSTGLSLFSDTGNLVLKIGTRSSSIQATIPEGVLSSNPKLFTLSVCASEDDTTGTVKFLQGNEVVSTYDINL